MSRIAGRVILGTAAGFGSILVTAFVFSILWPVDTPPGEEEWSEIVYGVSGIVAELLAAIISFRAVWRWTRRTN